MNLANDVRFQLLCKNPFLKGWNVGYGYDNNGPSILFTLKDPTGHVRIELPFIKAKNAFVFEGAHVHASELGKVLDKWFNDHVGTSGQEERSMRSLVKANIRGSIRETNEKLVERGRLVNKLYHDLSEIVNEFDRWGKEIDRL